MKWWKKQHELLPLNEQQRAEKLAQVGYTLRLKRQEKKLSLEQVAAQTHIQQRFLQAIEAGEPDRLPEPIYIQSFVKQYAEALGLDGTELASSFPIDDYRQVGMKPIGIIPAAQFQTTHLYLLYILVIVCTVSTLSHLLSRSEIQLSSQQQPSASTDKREQTPPSEKLKPVSATPNAVSKINRSVQVGVTLKAESWIRVVADGKKQFEGLLPQGTQRTWVAKEQLTVRVGNAGGVLVNFNQEQAKPLGQPGQVQEVTFGADTRL